MVKTLVSIILISVGITAISQTVSRDELQGKHQKVDKEIISNGISDDHLKYLLEKDTVIRIEYPKSVPEEKAPAYFVNGMLVNQAVLSTLESNTIDKLFVEKGEYQYGGKTYFGKISITLKEPFEVKPISISDLGSKYLDLPNNKTIFSINDKIVFGDYSEFFVNERSIYKIEVRILNNEGEDLKLNIVNLITRSETNIKESERIMIRGVE